MRLLPACPPRWIGWYLRLDLWPRLAIVVVAGFALMFTMLAIIALLASEGAARRIYKERLALTEMAAGQLDWVFDHAVEELQKARELSDFDPADPDRTAEAERLAHLYGRIGTFTVAVAWHDAEGKLLLRQPHDPQRIGRSEADAPHLGEAIRRLEPVVMGPVQDVFTRRYTIAVTLPIVQDGRLVALLSGFMPLDSEPIMRVLLQAQSLSQTGHAQLVDLRGLVIASTEPGEGLQAAAHLDLYRRMGRERRAVVEVVPCEPCSPHEAADGPHLMAYAPLEFTPFGVAIGGSAAETLAPVYTLRRRINLTALVSVVGLVIATLWGARRLARPVEALTVAADRLAQGDLNTSIRVLTGGEVGRLALALDRMRQELQGRTLQLEQLNRERSRLLERVMTAQEEERRRIARELHDAASQTIASITMGLRVLEQSSELGEAHRQAGELRSMAHQALESVRQTAADLRPSILDDVGLAAAIRQHLQAFHRRFGVETEWEERLPPDLRLSPPVETALYRILQEALTNVVQYAGSRLVWVILAAEAGRLELVVRDDGCGFSVEQVLVGPLERKLGILGMQERAAFIGADFEILSQPGSGTTVRVTLPLPSVNGSPLGSVNGRVNGSIDEAASEPAHASISGSTSRP